MLLEEFEKLTGFYPTMDLFEVIHEAYMKSPKDKTEWCGEYVKNLGGIAEKIRDAADTMKMNAKIEADEQVKRLSRQIEEAGKEQELLKKRIKELENWTPYLPSQMSDDDYMDLSRHDTGKFDSPDDVQCWIRDEFGFATDTIEVLDVIPEYEKSREGRIRKTGREAWREPVYASTDWNYVRFDVRTYASTFQWEVVNGDLYKYND